MWPRSSSSCGLQWADPGPDRHAHRARAQQGEQQRPQERIRGWLNTELTSASHRRGLLGQAARPMAGEGISSGVRLKPASREHQVTAPAAVPFLDPGGLAVTWPRPTLEESQVSASAHIPG